MGVDPCGLTEEDHVQFLVENGLAGAQLAVSRNAAAVVVDALRASANIASLFHYGAQRAIVVREVEEALAQKRAWPNAALVGERGGPRAPGFDLGNSPLQAPPELPIEDVIFSSSNCSRCCVGVAAAPAAFLGTTVNAAAVANALLAGCARLGISEVVLVTAGAVEDEVILTLEDHLAAGAIIAACEGLGADAAIANDRAWLCRLLFGDGDQRVLTARFQGSQNGLRLADLGLGADVLFASRLDLFDVAPRIQGLVGLEGGGQGAMILRH